MPKVHFVTQNITVQVISGSTILEAARSADIAVESPCTTGFCGKCRVRLANPDQLAHVKEGGMDRLSFAGQDSGYLLACQTRIYGDIDVILDSTGKEDRNLRILTMGEAFAYAPSPNITKQYNNGVTEVYGGQSLLGTEAGDTTEHIYGIALDIGTTTLTAELYHLPSGRYLASDSMLNPQSSYAQDVLSRIHFAAQEGGTKKLHEAFLSAFSSLRKGLIRQTNINSRQIYEIIYSGNTTMLHLALGINPASLGQYPYLSAIRGGEYLPAANTGIAPFGLIYLPPVISAFLGADIASGILATQLGQKCGAALLIDIGTNGEIILAVNGQLAGASTAAGPAFEGMSIACGMRAIPGAIERFRILDDNTFTYETIGQLKATGICGSGLLDIVGELVRTGIVGKDGRLLNSFHISEEIFLTQQDVRQVQLAKGALCSGIAALLTHLSVAEDQVEEVLIAGSFGYHLHEDSLINIGLLPSSFRGKIRFTGNTSQSGASALLLNRSLRADLQELTAHIKQIELANTPGYDKLFISCLGF